jgi:PAS domain S-box-containing protein
MPSKDFNRVKIELDKLVNESWDIRRSKPNDSFEIALKVRSISKEIFSDYYLALSYRNSGAALYILSQYSEALTDLLQAKSLFEKIENKQGLTDVIRNIGNIYNSLNQTNEAKESYYQAKAICEEINDRQGIAYNLGNIGYVNLLEKKYKEAILSINQAIEILEEISDILGLADAYNNLGKIYFEQGDFDLSYRLFKKSLQLSESITHLRGIANSKLSLAKVDLKRMNFKNSEILFKESLSAAITLGEVATIIECNNLLADYYEKTENYKLSLFYFREYENLKNKNIKESNERLISSLKKQNLINTLELEKELLESKNIELSEANDLINRKNNELELLSLVANNTDNIILIFDSDLKLEWANQSFTTFVGKEYSDILINSRIELNSLSTNKEIGNLIKLIIENNHAVQYESTYTNSKGIKKWLSSTLSPVLDNTGELKKIILIDSDITVLKQNEEIINQKNKNITDSINYAERIQKSLLPQNNLIEKLFADHFIFYKPRDIVSGDFYWVAEVGDYTIAAAIDCTGHGVPGAMMSMITSAFLNSIIHKTHINSPSEILKELYSSLDFLFSRYNPTTKTTDGLDIAIVEIHKHTKEIRFSGVNRNLYLVRNSEIIEYKAYRNVSSINKQELSHLIDIVIDYKVNDVVYLFSDGFVDQFGEENNTKFGTKKFKNLLSSISSLSCSKQLEIIDSEFNHWKGSTEQTDDILIFGFKL